MKCWITAMPLHAIAARGSWCSRAATMASRTSQSTPTRCWIFATGSRDKLYNPRPDHKRPSDPRRARFPPLSRMNVFYEEEGTFKVGAILADNDTSLQIEAAHGKRSKIKASAVLLRFDQPALNAFADAAQRLGADIDADFLWQCCGADEFSFDVLGKEYFGHAPSA